MWVTVKQRTKKNAANVHVLPGCTYISIKLYVSFKFASYSSHATFRIFLAIVILKSVRFFIAVVIYTKQNVITHTLRNATNSSFHTSCVFSTEYKGRNRHYVEYVLLFIYFFFFWRFLFLHFSRTHYVCFLFHR